MKIFLGAALALATLALVNSNRPPYKPLPSYRPTPSYKPSPPPEILQPTPPKHRHTILIQTK